MNIARRFITFAIFSMLALLFATIAAWLVHNNYVNDTALFNWSSITSIFDAENVRLENIGFTRPHGSMLVLIPFYYISWVGSYSPYVVSVLTAALLLTLWNMHLKQGEYTLTQRALLVLAMAINPAILWGATGGGGESIALLMFYLLYRSCLRMVYEKDIRSFIALGMVLAVFFYFDVISIFIFIALLPLLMLIVPVPMLRESPISVYIIIGMPLLIILASWTYFNWIYLGDPLAFIHSYGTVYSGAKIHAETLPWLRDYGGRLFIPIVLALKYEVFGYPVLIFLLYRNHKEQRQLRTSLVLMFHPAIAVGIATASYYLASPLQITVLIAASVMAEISRLACGVGRCFTPLLALLLLGGTANWILFAHDSYTHVRPWAAALISDQPEAHKGDVTLGRWLVTHRAPTLLDLQSGYRVIAARGDAKGLLLPFTPEYRIAMRSGNPGVAQIAVPDPASQEGRRDAINMRFPQLYESGLAGYERVYDEYDWRVYRRQY